MFAVGVAVSPLSSKGGKLPGNFDFPGKVTELDFVNVNEFGEVCQVFRVPGNSVKSRRISAKCLLNSEKVSLIYRISVSSSYEKLRQN